MRQAAELPVLALTAGEPAGIGPDLCIALSQQALPCRLSVLGDAEVLRARAAQLGIAVDFLIGDAIPAHRPGALHVRHIPVALPVTAGVLDPHNSAHVLALLDAALDGCMNGSYHAVVTAPVHKGVINDAGFAFTGHTEYLADHSGTKRVVMMLAGGGLRVALATTHLPLREVADAITPALLDEVIRILHADLQSKFGIARPRILVAGLNPHAGESGHLGREEIDIIEPALDRLRGEGMDLVGPLPADTLFSRIRHEPCDAVLAMYHDQGLPVLKYASFGAGVNITLGLPFIRTSVDHGTALDLAGTGRAEVGSLLTAIDVAMEMVGRQRRVVSGYPAGACFPALDSRLTMHTPRKRFGQNFLIDDGIIHAIVNAIHPQAGETVVEIGPGLGALTKPLLERLPHLHAVELDRDIVARLQRSWPADRLTIHSCDALKFDFGALGHDQRIIGNLPYNISTPLLFHLMEFAAHIRDMTFMLQKEVVERMVAEPSTPDYGRLSIMLQRRFHLEWLLDVPPTAFNPPPKVDSAVVRLIPKTPAEIVALDEALFARVVAAAFSQRRKTLRNTLGSLMKPEDFAAVGIDSGQRAENLAVADYEAITRHLARLQRPE